MDVPQPPFSEQGTKTGPAADPRLQPTPDYGSLGPGSDCGGGGGDPARNPQRRASIRTAQIVAAVTGMLAALFVGALRNANLPWTGFGRAITGEKKGSGLPKSPRQLDGMDAQRQAETLLEQAVGHSAEAVEQISSRADQWRGQVRWNSQIANLTTTALNSDDMRVRASGVEVELAAYGLAKNPASLDYVLKTAESPDHAQKIWGLWALGLLANRGVESEHVVGVLVDHLKDEDVDSRRWAVEGLALAGTDSTIEPLLTTMHDDSSPAVRERAACGIAASGLFTPEQRMTAVPKLIEYSEDPALDAQTHGWAFQALGDITHQRFGSDSAAWRQWYEKQSGQ